MGKCRFGIAYKIDLPLRASAMAIASRHSTRKELDSAYSEAIERYRRFGDEDSAPPVRIEILNEKKCRLVY